MRGAEIKISAPPISNKENNFEFDGDFQLLTPIHSNPVTCTSKLAAQNKAKRGKGGSSAYINARVATLCVTNTGAIKYNASVPRWKAAIPMNPNAEAIMP